MSYEKAKSLIRSSISRPTLYKVLMPQQFVGGNTNDYLEYFCVNANIPEVRVESAVARGHEYIGRQRAQPALVIWSNPMQITVIENRDFTVHKDFKKWFDRLGTGVNQEAQDIKMNYYDTIKGDIKLIKLENPDEAGRGGGGNLKEVLTVNFVNAYPKAIGAVALSSENRNAFTTFSVEFQYESYTTQYS